MNERSGPGADAGRCAPAAQDRRDDLAGTAVRSLRFLLIEQSGAWGRHALTMSRLDPAVGREVAERAAAVGTRTLVIRRPGRSATDAPRRWFLVDTRVGGGIRGGFFDVDAELLPVVQALESSVERGLPPQAGNAYAEPLFLVCTHGRHDACCAIRGRPVAAAFAAVEPESTWECSHVGGDRFAANVLVMPQGLTYGWVEDQAVPGLVEAHRSGRIVPALLRGRATYPPAVQAAQRHARELLGELAIDALPPGRPATQDGRVWVVDLEHPSGTVQLRLQQVGSGEPGRLTCSSLTALSPPRWEVLAVSRPGAAATAGS